MEIESLSKELVSGNPGRRGIAVEQLAKLASEGDKRAARVLRFEVLEREKNLDVIQKVFERPITDCWDDKRTYFFENKNKPEYILPLIKAGELSDPVLKNLIIERAKEYLHLTRSRDEGLISFLSYILDDDEKYDYIRTNLSKYGCNISSTMEFCLHNRMAMQKLAQSLKDFPGAYSKNFVKIFAYFIENPNPDVDVRDMWYSLPLDFKDAVRLYYCKEMKSLMERLEMDLLSGDRSPEIVSLPQNMPQVEWLNSLEKMNTISQTHTNSVLQKVAETMAFHLKDCLPIEETNDFSPLTIQQRELVSCEGRESNISTDNLFPIDKYLGEYIPDLRLIRLYMQEIYRTAWVLDLDVDALKQVVEFHEAAHAIVHLGRDAEGRMFDIEAYGMVDGGANPGPVHEILAQLICYHCVKNNHDLLECFEELNKSQPHVYTMWKIFQSSDLERVRSALNGMREGVIDANFTEFKKFILG